MIPPSLFAALMLVAGAPGVDIVVLLAMVYFAAERYPLTWQVRDTRWTVTLSLAASVPTAFFYPGPWIGPVVAVAGLAAQVALGQRLRPACASIASAAAAAATGGAVVAVWFGPRNLTGVVVGVVAGVVVRHSLLLLDRHLCATADPAPPVSALSRILTLHTLVSLSFGLLATWLLTVAPWALLGLAAPLGILLAMWRALTWKSDQERALSALLEANRDLRTPALNEAVIVLAAATQRLLAQRTGEEHAATVDVVVASPSRTQLYQGPATAPVLTRSDPAVLSLDWVRAGLSSADSVTFVAGETGTLGVVRVTTAGGLRVLVRTPFTARIARIDVRRQAEQLSDYAAVWLQQVSDTYDQPDGDQALLADACSRLVRLAGAGEVPLVDVLTELTTIEELTASLLGTTVTGPASGSHERHLSTVSSGRLTL